MGKRELSYRRKKINTSKHQKKNKFNKKNDKSQFTNEITENVPIQRNLPYDAVVSKLKTNTKYPKSLEYLSIFTTNKSAWKFNVK